MVELVFGNLPKMFVDFPYPLDPRALWFCFLEFSANPVPLGRVVEGVLPLLGMHLQTGQHPPARCGSAARGLPFSRHGL